jgi:hypothetical protein
MCGCEAYLSRPLSPAAHSISRIQFSGRKADKVPASNQSNPVYPLVSKTVDGRAAGDAKLPSPVVNFDAPDPAAERQPFDSLTGGTTLLFKIFINVWLDRDSPSKCRLTFSKSLL